MTQWFSNIKALFLSEKRDDALIHLDSIVGYKIQHKELFLTALTHRSFFDLPECTSYQSYERLEFLGDAILDAVIAEFLYHTFPTKDEGFLSKKRDQIVNGKMLAGFAKEMKLLEMMKIAAHAKKRVIGDSHKVYADVLEAIIGAIYLDHSFDQAKQFIHRTIISKLNIEDLSLLDENFKSQLLEEVQSTENPGDLSYLCVEETGPPHKREFLMRVKIGDQLWGFGRGKSKKDAEQHAAYETLKMFKKQVHTL